MPTDIRKVYELSPEEFELLQRKVLQAKLLGMNVNNLFTNKSNVNDLNIKLDTFLKQNVNKKTSTGSTFSDIDLMNLMLGK